MPPEGWTKGDYVAGSFGKYHWSHPDGRKEEASLPAESKPVGVIAIANTIPDMGALTKLDISNNNIEQGEALRRIDDLCNTKGIELDNYKSESDGDY
jgi:hypothetical protein